MNTYSDALEIKKEEFNVARNLLENGLNIEESSLYIRSLQRLTDLKVLNLSGTFVCIGCGPLPTTLLFAQKSFNIERLIGIDSDPLALDVAKNVYMNVSKLQAEFEESINNINLDSNETVHFFVANMVKPKAEVLKQVWHLASDKSIVIVREPGVHAKSQWEHISDKLDSKEWCVEKVFRQCIYFESRSVLLSKSMQLRTKV
jgi:trans-aconitate methyltransferase